MLDFLIETQPTKRIMDERLNKLIQRMYTDELTALEIDVLLTDDSNYDGYDLSIFLSQLKSSPSSLRTSPIVIFKIEKKIAQLLNTKAFSNKYSKASYEEEGYAEFKKVKMPYASIY